MARVKIKTLILDQYKGATHAEYTFGDRTAVSGCNGSGKTTMADGWYWLVSDRDYSLKSSPEVHPNHLEKSEPSVTAVCDVDGKEVTLRKFQKDSRTKKQIEAGAPVRISNQYEINDVPKSQKDFTAYLEELGVDTDNLLLLSHPEIFTSQKSADCRKILFGMVSDITDKEIADSLLGCEELSKLLESYKADEITAMKKRELKEAGENLKAIPEQIIGMERSKVDIDVSEFISQRDTLKTEIATLEDQLMEMRIPSIGELNQKLVSLEREQKALTAQANSERVAKLTEVDIMIGELKQKHRDLTSEKDRVSRSLEEKVRVGNQYGMKYEELAEEFKSAKASEFDATAQVCPTCGQDLPIKEIDRMHKAFEKNKRTRMDSINNEAKECRDKIKVIKGQIPEFQKQLAALDKQINAVQKDIDQKTAERVKYETPIDASGTPENQELLKEIATVHHQINRRDELQAQFDQILASKRDKEYAVRELEDKIAESKVNDRIDRQIAELKQKQKKNAQAEADCQKVLDQLSEVSMQKNKILTDQVNSHFEIVKFRLFYTQKDGQVKDCCVPTIRNEKGEYMQFGESANTALEVRGKLDIISGLQKFYGQYMPVFLDGAECLDQDNMAQIHMDTQLITLSVSDEPLTVRSE